MTATIIRRETVTIAAAGSVSTEVRVPHLSLVEVDLPAAWDAAGLTVQTADDVQGAPGPWRDAFSLAGEIVLPAGASRSVSLDPSLVPLAQWVRVRSGTSAAPVAQTQIRTIGLAFRDWR
jgi:hypothetical protein